MGTTTEVNNIVGIFSNIGTKRLIPSPKIIEEKMDEVLSAPEFQSHKDYLGELIADWLRKIFANIKVGEGTMNFAALAVFIITASLLGVLIIVVTLLVLRMIGKDTHVASLKRYANKEKLTVELALEYAEQEGNSANYTAAVKWFFLSLLLMLHGEKYIVLHESKTNRQYMTELIKSQYPHLELFQSLVLQFNNICYGGRQATQEDYLNWSQKISILVKDYRGIDRFEIKGGYNHKKK
ncbi:MAG: DUF4129 domain-containing protein [Clostridia bacterium]